MRTFFRSAVVVATMLASVAASRDAGAGKEGLPVARISVRGKIVDPSGTPCAQARVLLRVIGNRMARIAATSNISDVLAETRSDAAGRFTFEAVPIGAVMSPIADSFSQGQRAADVVAIAEGFGMGWAPLYDLEPTREISVALKPPAALTGTVSDDVGKPVAGAVLEVIGVSRLDGADDRFLEDPQSLSLYFSALCPRATSDADGRFRIAGLPDDHRFNVRVTHPDHPQDYFAMATGDQPVSPSAVEQWDDDEGETVYVNPVKLTLARGPRLETRVVDENGQARGGGHISLSNEGYRSAFVPPDGTLRVAVPTPGECQLYYTPPDGEPRLSLRRAITLSEAHIAMPRQFELRLPAARLVEGRVVAKGGDAGVPGVWVSWAADAKPANDAKGAAFGRAMTDGDGRFRLAALPGAGRISLDGDVAGYFVPGSNLVAATERNESALVVQVPDTGPVEPLRIEVSRGLVVKGRLIDAQRQPVADMAVRAASPRIPPRMAVTDGEGRFEIAGLNPREACVLSAVGDGAVAAHEVPGDKGHALSKSKTVDVELVLKPAVTLTGRIVLDDRPLTDVRLTLGAQHEGKFRTSVTTITGDDGRYRLSGLKPGQQYNIEVLPPVPAVDPRWHYQSAFAPTVPDDAEGELELPEMRLRHRSQSLTGVIVDPVGRPVANATISAELLGNQGMSLFRMASGPVPWTKSDKRGRFHLLQLPDEPLALMAYMEPQGGDNQIRFPARAEPKLNQQDIRIVLDPTLVDDEDN